VAHTLAVLVKDDGARLWRRRRRRRRRSVRRAAEAIAVLAFVVVVGSALLRRNTSSSTTTTSTAAPVGSARADIKMTSCNFDNYAARSGLTITNHTDQTFNYSVHVLFLDGKQLFGLGVATTDNLAGGHRVHVVAIALRTVTPKHLTCGITVINRFH
jgi:hypothetical protein